VDKVTLDVKVMERLDYFAQSQDISDKARDIKALNYINTLDCKTQPGFRGAYVKYYFKAKQNAKEEER
jgi:hypothetical protein